MCLFAESELRELVPLNKLLCSSKLSERSFKHILCKQTFGFCIVGCSALINIHYSKSYDAIHHDNITAPVKYVQIKKITSTVASTQTFLMFAQFYQEEVVRIHTPQ